jgi:ADP-heptose:LPS heptosyltransferase
MHGRVLIVRLDSAGDVLLAGPAIRAVAESAPVVLLAGPRGAEAARLLPGVSELLIWECPWIDPEPKPARREDVDRLAAMLTDIERAIILTSFHQDPLPTALALRMAGVPHITAASEDYPGSLLDVRHRLPGTGLHEVQRMLSVTEAAGFPPPADQRLSINTPAGRRGGPYVVVHPGASVPARAPLAADAAGYVKALKDDGWRVLVTGDAAERDLTRQVAAGNATDLGGATTLAELAAILRHASAVVTPNTGPAHLAAATGTPVVSLFAPTVPAERWRPWLVPHVILGDQNAPCADSRARLCPAQGHPCLASVTSEQVVSAVRRVCR